MEKDRIPGIISFGKDGQLLLNGMSVSYAYIDIMIDGRDISICFNSPNDEKCFETMFILYLIFGLHLEANEIVKKLTNYYSLIVKL